MSSDYQRRQAEWAEKQQAKEDDERKDEITIGEVSGTVAEDIGTSDEIKIKIDDTETLKFKPASTLKKGDSVRVTIKADLTTKDHNVQRWGRERNVNAGEAFGKVTGKIRKSHEIKARIDNIGTLKFSSSADLKKGDYLRVIIGKI
jgi:hypothetical protein